MGTGPSEPPGWVRALGDEDFQFLKRFLLASGSLKSLADEYGVSYPTVRARLDRLIAKVREAEDPASRDPFERALRLLVADGKMAPAMARDLWDAHRASIRARDRGDPTEEASR